MEPSFGIYQGEPVHVIVWFPTAPFEEGTNSNDDQDHPFSVFEGILPVNTLSMDGWAERRLRKEKVLKIICRWPVWPPADMEMSYNT